jgi:hypothetical protein
MPRGLKNEPQIWKLARDLGLSGKVDPLNEIISYCCAELRALIKQVPCATLTELLQNAATILDTIFVEIRTDEELIQLCNRFIARGEKEFAWLQQELQAGVFAVTIRLLKPKLGERQFISIIDCRGEKAFRSYYSKWHELAHLLTLTDQLRFKFCRTHSSINKNDPEEALMEAIAGQVGFLSDLVKSHAKGQISFQKIAELRERLCPEASQQASTIGFSRNWPSPCVLIEAGLEYRKRERDKLDQRGFEFIEPPTPELRLLHISSSLPAPNLAKLLHPNMRVPKCSTIYKVFFEGYASDNCALENLSWWETSKDGYLPSIAIRVEARKQADSVQALLIPGV